VHLNRWGFPFHNVRLEGPCERLVVFSLYLIAGLHAGELEQSGVIGFDLLRGVGACGQVAQDFGEEMAGLVDEGG